MSIQINKSHSKSDLVRIIETFNLGDSEYLYLDYNKIEIQEFLIGELSKLSEIDFDNDLYFDDLNELINFLKKPNMSKIPIKTKNEILQIAKNINYYYKTNNLRDIENLDDLFRKGKYISDYGDIPSVRRAIKLINSFHYKDIELNITPKIHYELIETQTKKQNNKPQLKIIYHSEPIIINLD
tara:strand:+ start:490 stop:1038 length:549 start_codon:yes stop_codon:yes gene_type:complete